MCPRAAVPTGRRTAGTQAQRRATQLEYGGLRVSFVTFVSSDNASTVELCGGASETNVGARAFFRALPVPTSNVAFLSSRVSARPSVRFDISRLRRIGFTEDLKAADDYWKSRLQKVLEAHEGGGRVRKLGDEGTKERTYEIRHVSFSSGRDRRFAGRCGSGYFASDLLRGGPDTFWPIEFHTIEKHRLGGGSALDAELGSAIESDLEIVPGRIGRQECSVELVYNPRRQAAFLDALDGWCTRHPDRLYTLSCPGDRGPSSHATSLHCSFPVFERSHHRQCLQAALANAIHALEGSQSALSMLRKWVMACRSLAEASAWVQDNTPVLGLQ